VHTPTYHRPIHDCDEGTTLKASTPIWTARRHPCSNSTCCRQKRSGRWTRKKRRDRKSSCLCSACTSSDHGARTGSWTVPIGAKHQEPKHPFGLPQGSPAQPTCAAVRHAPRLSVPARNRASAKALPVLSVHDLCL
jgi:hypothetical protein